MGEVLTISTKDATTDKESVLVCVAASRANRSLALSHATASSFLQAGESIGSA